MAACATPAGGAAATPAGEAFYDAPAPAPGSFAERRRALRTPPPQLGQNYDDDDDDDDDDEECRVDIEYEGSARRPRTGGEVSLELENQRPSEVSLGLAEAPAPGGLPTFESGASGYPPGAREEDEDEPVGYERTFFVDPVDATAPTTTDYDEEFDSEEDA